jgi:hypothetical protein
MTVITLNKRDIEKCRKFAHDRATCPTAGIYKARGGFKYVDVLAGAMGDIAVFLMLKKRYKTVVPPDFTLYGVGEKSYDADIITRNKNFHVKCQTTRSQQRYGSSWLMQKNDPILAKPTDKDYLVFTNVDIEKGEVTIHGEWLIKDLIEQGKVGECKVASYAKTKVAFYLDDLVPERSEV